MRLISIICGVSYLALCRTSFAAPIDYNDPKNQWHGDNSSSSGSSSYSNSNQELVIGIESGYRTSELEFNIASDPTGTATPNILSELQWKKISGYEFQPKIEYTQKTGSLRGLHLEASANKSITTSGENQDSDYLGNNRTAEFSRSNNNSDAGHSEGFSAAIGYAFDFNGSNAKTLARFTTLIGYARQDQKVTMRNGNQTVSDYGFGAALGSFDGLRSSYSMNWAAPFIGAELTSNFGSQHIKFRGQYFKGTYDATGNWNLRSDFAHPESFTHSADGDGFLLRAEYGWQFQPKWQLTISAGLSEFKTDAGTDVTHFSNGTNSSTRLNQAKWSSQSYMAGLNYIF